MAYTAFTVTAVSAGSINSADTNLVFSGSAITSSAKAYAARTVNLEASSDGGATWTTVGTFTLPAYNPPSNGNSVHTNPWTATIAGVPAMFTGVNDVNFVFRGVTTSADNGTGATFNGATSAAVPVDTMADAGAAATVSFADQLVNAAEGPTTSFTVANLDADVTRAVVTFTSSGGGTPVTATVTANGTFSVNLSSLGDGTISTSMTINDDAGAVVVDGSNSVTHTGGGTTTLDRTAPTATTTIGLTTDTGATGDGITSNPALSGTSSVAGAGQVITIKDGATVIGTATTAANGTWSFANAGATQAAHSYTASVTDTAGNLGAAGSTTPASVTVDTTADTDVLVDLIDATAGPTSASIAFDLANLDAGSTATVTFTGAGGGTVSQAYTTNGAQTANISGLVGNVTATVSVTDRAGTTTAGSGDTLAADPVCFYPGTLIRTPSGNVAVEALRTGDLVLTHAGHVAPVRWMGRQTIATRFADALTALPIRIQAGALADNLPERDLLVSPGHAILLHGLLVQAGALVNGTSIRREAAVPEIFTYHHVELHDHALVLAEGVPAETYVANVERIAFDNAAEHVALYGVEVAIAELNLPRAKSHRQVPMALRQQIAARATALTGAIAA